MEVLVITGAQRKRPDPKYSGDKRWTFWANSAAFVDGKPVFEKKVLRVETRPEDTVNKGENPKMEMKIHREVYDLLPGTEIVLHLDAGDDKGRFHGYATDIVCRVSATGGRTIGNQYGSISGVEFVRREYPQDKDLTEQLVF